MGFFPGASILNCPTKNRDGCSQPGLVVKSKQSRCAHSTVIPTDNKSMPVKTNAQLRGPTPQTVLAIALFLIVFLFLMTRLPFFLYDPVWGVFPDSPGYYLPVDQMDKGFYPTFTARTPGYPLFLMLVTTIFSTNLAVICVQNLFSLLSIMTFIFMIHLIVSARYRWSALLAALGMGAFLSATVHLYSDTSLLTESIYVNSIILFFASLLYALHHHKSWLWVFPGTALTGAILIRPSALCFFPVVLLIILFVIINKRGYKSLISFLSPPMIMLIFMGVYNHFTIGTFSISPFGEHALLSFTNTFMDPDPAYPDNLNRAIRRCRERMRPIHRQAIETSWDVERINRILQKYYNLNRRLFFNALVREEAPEADDLYMKWRPLVRRAGMDAILNHPGIYLKYVYSNLMVYFFHKKTDHNFYASLQRRYAIAYRFRKRFSGLSAKEIFASLRIYYANVYRQTLSEAFSQMFLKEYWSLGILSKEEISALLKKPIRMGFLHKLHRGYEQFHNFLFRSDLWIFFFLLALVGSAGRWVFSRFRHQGAFFVLVLTASALFHGIVVAMSALPTDRLNYPLDYVYYLSLFLAPLLIIPNEKNVGHEDTSSVVGSLLDENS